MGGRGANVSISFWGGGGATQLGVIGLAGGVANGPKARGTKTQWLMKGPWLHSIHCLAVQEAEASTVETRIERREGGSPIQPWTPRRNSKLTCADLPQLLQSSVAAAVLSSFWLGLGSESSLVGCQCARNREWVGGGRSTQRAKRWASYRKRKSMLVLEAPKDWKALVVVRPSQTERQVRVVTVAVSHFSFGRSSQPSALGRNVSNVPSKYRPPVASCAVYGRMTSETQPTNHSVSRDGGSAIVLPSPSSPKVGPRLDSCLLASR